jgi:transposase InsO family protein
VCSHGRSDAANLPRISSSTAIRGTEYTSLAFCTFVARRGVRQSLSVRGPEDNAHAESFFHSLKAELTRGAPLGTELQLRRGLDEYIRYYNTRRLHSALGYRSPVAFEREAAIEL